MADNTGLAEHHVSVTVDAPVHQVYGMFTHFNDFPKFMSFVKEVTYYDDQRSHWVAEVVGRHEWDAVNENWVEDQQVGWHSTSGLENFGRVTFQPMGGRQTRVDVFVNYNPPAGVLGDIGENLGVGSRFDSTLQHDLENFARMVQQAPPGALDPASSNYLFHEGSAAAKGTTTQQQNATMGDQSTTSQSDYQQSDHPQQQGSYPQDTTSQSDYQQSDHPQQQGSYPQGTTSQSDYQQSDYSQQQGSYPQGATSQSDYPQQQGSYPQGATSQSDYPQQQGSYPQGATSQSDYQQSDYPQQQGGYQQGATSQSDYQQSGYPQQQGSYPQGATSQSDYQQSDYPQQQGGYQPNAGTTYSTGTGSDYMTAPDAGYTSDTPSTDSATNRPAMDRDIISGNTPRDRENVTPMPPDTGTSNPVMPPDRDRTDY